MLTDNERIERLERAVRQMTVAIEQLGMVCGKVGYNWLARDTAKAMGKIWRLVEETDSEDRS